MYLQAQTSLRRRRDRASEILVKMHHRLPRTWSHSTNLSQIATFKSVLSIREVLAATLMIVDARQRSTFQTKRVTTLPVSKRRIASSTSTLVATSRDTLLKAKLTAYNKIRRSIQGMVAPNLNIRSSAEGPTWAVTVMHPVPYSFNSRMFNNHS